MLIFILKWAIKKFAEGYGRERKDWGWKDCYYQLAQHNHFSLLTYMISLPPFVVSLCTVEMSWMTESWIVKTEAMRMAMLACSLKL